MIKAIQEILSFTVKCLFAIFNKNCEKQLCNEIDNARKKLELINEVNNVRRKIKRNKR